MRSCAARSGFCLFVKPERVVQNGPCEIKQAEEHVDAGRAEGLQEHAADELADDSADVAAEAVVGGDAKAFAAGR